MNKFKVPGSTQNESEGRVQINIPLQVFVGCYSKLQYNGKLLSFNHVYCDDAC